MSWVVEHTPEFRRWWISLSHDEQESVDTSIGLLEARGPHLSFPHSSRILASRHANMRELRIQHHGRPYRVLYAFDPRRVALLLIGGEKTGRNRWYEQFVPIADRLLEQHLNELRNVRKRNG